MENFRKREYALTAAVIGSLGLTLAGSQSAVEASPERQPVATADATYDTQPPISPSPEVTTNHQPNELHKALARPLVAEHQTTKPRPVETSKSAPSPTASKPKQETRTQAEAQPKLKATSIGFWFGTEANYKGLLYKAKSHPEVIANAKLVDTIGKEVGLSNTAIGAVDNIAYHESGFRTTAVPKNEQDKADPTFGIPQANPGSKMASIGPDWRTNPRTQIKWMLKYIKQVYKTPERAWAFWQAHNWY